MAERKAAGQPVDFGTGAPIFRETEFDPMSAKDARKANRELKKILPKPEKRKKRKKKRKR